MELLTYFRALRRRWVVIVVCLVLGGAVGYASTLLSSSETAKKGRTYYKATTTLVLDPSGSSGSTLQPAVTNLDQVAILATTGDVPNAVADKLGTTEIGRELAERVVTTTNGLTSTLDITAVGATADEASQLADTFGDELIAGLQQRDQDRYDTAVTNLDAKIASLQAQANGYLSRLNTTPPPPDADTIRKQYDATQNNYYARFSEQQDLVSNGPAVTNLTILESSESQPINSSEYESRLSLGALGQNHLQTGFSGATTPLLASRSSSFDSPLARAFIGAFLGLLVGIGLALFADRLDRRMRHRDEVEAAFGLPVLADVPRLSKGEQADDELVSFSAPLSRAAEAFRAVRTSLVFQQSVAFGDPTPAVTNGGQASQPLFEHEIHDTLVVMVTSAAPREGKSTTSANLAVAFAETDASVLVVNCDFRRPTVHRRFGVLDEPRRVQDTNVPGVKIVTNVLTDQRANPSQVVAAQRQVVAAARGRFDVIILDTAPLLTANDAIDLVGSADLVLLVAQVGMSTTDSARRVIDLLTRANAALAGVVLVGTPDASNDYYYYYQQVPAVAGRRAGGFNPSNGNGNGTGAGAGDIFGARGTPGDTVPRAH